MLLQTMKRQKITEINVVTITFLKVYNLLLKGSAHTVLAGYWSEKLGKKKMLGRTPFSFTVRL